MKIYKREILEKTRFKKYPFKKVGQFYIADDSGKIIFSNCHAEDMNFGRLKIPFEEVKNLEELSKHKSVDKQILERVAYFNNTKEVK